MGFGAVVTFWPDKTNGFGGSPSARVRGAIVWSVGIAFLFIFAAYAAAAQPDQFTYSTLNDPPAPQNLFARTSAGQPLVDVPPSLDSQLRPRELTDSPMAPLPPALIAGPIGIMVAGWMAHRANRRGGKI